MTGTNSERVQPERNVVGTPVSPSTPFFGCFGGISKTSPRVQELVMIDAKDMGITEVLTLIEDLSNSIKVDTLSAKQAKSLVNLQQVLLKHLVKSRAEAVKVIQVKDSDHALKLAAIELEHSIKSQAIEAEMAATIKESKRVRFAMDAMNETIKTERQKFEGFNDYLKNMALEKVGINPDRPVFNIKNMKESARTRRMSCPAVVYAKQRTKMGSDREPAEGDASVVEQVEAILRHTITIQRLFRGHYHRKRFLNFAYDILEKEVQIPQRVAIRKALNKRSFGSEADKQDGDGGPKLGKRKSSGKNKESMDGTMHTKMSKELISP